MDLQHHLVGAAGFRPRLLNHWLCAKHVGVPALPLAYLVAGPLADYVFEPLMVPDGPLAGSVGQFIGVGPGRGIGLMFMVMGTLTMIVTVVAYLYPRLRLMEDELPNAIDPRYRRDLGFVVIYEMKSSVNRITWHGGYRMEPLKLFRSAFRSSHESKRTTYECDSATTSVKRMQDSTSASDSHNVHSFSTKQTG
jgi:hypothetical protein